MVRQDNLGRLHLHTSHTEHSSLFIRAQKIDPTSIATHVTDIINMLSADNKTFLEECIDVNPRFGHAGQPSAQVNDLGTCTLCPNYSFTSKTEKNAAQFISVSSLSRHRKKEAHTARNVRPGESLGEKQRRQKKNTAKRKRLRLLPSAMRFGSTDSDSDAEDMSGQRDEGRKKKQAPSKMRVMRVMCDESDESDCESCQAQPCVVDIENPSWVQCEICHTSCIMCWCGWKNDGGVGGYGFSLPKVHRRTAGHRNNMWIRLIS